VIHDSVLFYPHVAIKVSAPVTQQRSDARFLVSDTAVERISGPFALVAANLRLPTLLRLAPSIAAWTPPGAAVVLSGIRVEERTAVVCAYESESFETTWSAEEDEWIGLALRKKAVKKGGHP